MGLRGPAPKRVEDRNGHRSREEREGDDVTRVSQTVVTSGAISQPQGSTKWDTVAKRIWKAAGTSAQSALYQETDWAVLRLMLDEVTAYRAATKRNSQHLGAIMSALTDLLLCEGDRRRRGIEVARRDTPVKPPAASKDWDADVRKLWRAMPRSEVTKFYEPTDWAVAHFLLSELSLFRSVPFRSGQLLTTLLVGLDSLMLTEGKRRQLGLETKKNVSAAPSGKSAGIIEMETWRKKLGG